MQRLRRGDPAGLEALMDRYTPYLSAIAARVLPGRPQDWEELTADVFLAAWENRRKLQPEKVKGWLAVTMALEDQEAARLVREALDTLDRTDRELFVRRYYYGQTVARAAEEMGLNLSTAKSRLRRGREKLKELLGKAGYEFEAD